MKSIVHYFVLFTIVVLIFSCSDEKIISKIEVGMTYDEVEAIFGKPASITRGANELYTNYENIPSNILKNLTTVIEDNPKYEQWAAPKELKTIGNLIYVTWLYTDVKKDTAFIAFNSYKEVNDTSYTKIIEYYIGDQKVTKDQYMNFDGVLYLSPSGKTMSKSDYDRFVYLQVSKMKPPIKGEKRVVNRTIKNIKAKEVISSVNKKYYEVTNIKTVVFDASSGRVTFNGYFPMYLNEIFING